MFKTARQTIFEAFFLRPWILGPYCSFEHFNIPGKYFQIQLFALIKKLKNNKRGVAAEQAASDSNSVSCFELFDICSRLKKTYMYKSDTQLLFCHFSYKYATRNFH
jgi:hypothetical protein